MDYLALPAVGFGQRKLLGRQMRKMFRRSRIQQHHIRQEHSFCIFLLYLYSLEFMTGFHFSRRLLARVSTCRQNQVSTGCPRSIYCRSLGRETHDGKQFLLLELVKNGPRSKTVKTCQDNFECLGIVLRLRVSESCCFSRFLPWERHLDRMPHNEEMVRGSDTAAACRSRKGLQHTFVGSMQDAGCLDSANITS